jgi:acyl carrier protein
MTHAQWEATIRSKVETSWNLHNILPQGMDFFVLLSSLSGIYGSVSQANYAAGNTFKDALARYRTSHGEKAVAFNLGWMRTIGIIAENEEYQKLRELGADMAKVESEELLSLFNIYCDPAHPVLHPDKSQLLVGVVTPGECLAMGMEPPFNMRHPLFAGFRQSAGGTSVTDDQGGVDFPSLFKRTDGEEAKADVVVQALAVKLGRALSMTPDDIDATKPLFEYGVDSLVAVELRNWIGKEFAADIAVFDIMGGSTVSAIGALVAKRTATVPVGGRGNKTV